MDFIVRERVFLVFLCLSLGAFGDQIEPSIQNMVAVAGSPSTTFTCSSSQNPKMFEWTMFPVGGEMLRVIKSGSNPVDSDDFEASLDPDGKGSHIIVRIANVSTAGVYTCDENNKKSAQFVVITEEPACNINPKPYNALTCNEISEFACTLKYAANDSYVVADMKWSIGESSESLKSSIAYSTSANITTATSTLKLAAPEKYTSISKYKCNTTFSLKDTLPSGFVTNKLNYTSEWSPNADACKLLSEGGAPTEMPNGNTTEKPNGNRNENLDGKTTKRSAGKPTDKSGEDSDGKGGGLSVGLSKRNIFIKCVVGIAVFLLIGRGTGV